MNIAIVGYGKMGKAIAEIAAQRNHTIAVIIDADNAQEINNLNHYNTQVAIEFTTPETAYNNIATCMLQSVPTVCGSTGWNNKIIQAEALCTQHNTSLIVASNYSVGVNLFFALNTKLAQLMQPQQQYIPNINEVHHTQKLDAPSGTAITLAQQIINNNNHYTSYTTTQPISTHQLYITSQRIDPAPGTHTVTYTSLVDDIAITHTAHSRTGFALGAILAAEYIYNKKGIFTMKDVIGM